METNVAVSEVPASVCAGPAERSLKADPDPLLDSIARAENGAPMLGGVLIRNKLGEGGMAGVYLGWHTRLRAPVAVKILKDPSGTNLPMFLREARLMVSVDHPNLVRVFDVNVEPRSGLHYIVMEYVEGCSAYQLLTRQLMRLGQPLTQISALEIGLSAAKALAAAHDQGIVHRDVKSDNILIRQRDGAVKVADLGFAGFWKRTEGAKADRNTTVGGTIGFLSPEVLEGKPITPAADIYALGATLYELLTGYLPYGPPYDDSYHIRQLTGEPKDVREHVVTLDEDVAKLIARCLEHDPERRYADGHQLAEALERVLRKLVGTKMFKAIQPPEEPPERPVVLCVDDDEAVLDLLRDILAGQGFNPVCFTSPDEAVQKLPAIQPDVAVLDYNMPGMNGVQLCQGLRRVQGYHELAVLIVSGNADPDTVHEALDRGITDYLLKPVDTQELVVRVRLLSKLRAMNKERRVIETQLLKLRQRSSHARLEVCKAS
jgi:serine/threonine protein kinase